MKKSILFLVLLQSLLIFAQAPQKMTYQSVVRNSANVLLANQAVGVRISILEGTPAAAVYSETHTVTTNANGLFTLEAGGGTPAQGVFADIVWGNGSHYIKSEIDPAGGTNYTLSATKELLSVPYALNGITTAQADAIAAQASTIAAMQAQIAAMQAFILPKTYTIGLWPELGGYVFRISADGKHGLVSEIQDQGTSNWIDAQNLISDASTHSENGKNFTDWRLPNKNELTQMVNSRDSIGGFFIDTFYWCSTDLIPSNAYNITFTDEPTHDPDSRFLTYPVRAVRAF